MILFTYDDIQKTLKIERDLGVLLEAQKQAFIDFSEKRITVPLPMQLHFHNHLGEPVGDCHVKAGYGNSDHFIVKVATGFPLNAAHHLPSGDGIMILFDAKTGLIKALFQDKAYLTHLRTALAVCAVTTLTPFPVEAFGIVGTGTQAKLCAQLLRHLYPEAPVYLWGRSEDKARAMALEHDTLFCPSLDDLLNKVTCVVTTTSSHTPLFYAHQVKYPLHIIAVGADGGGKQELAPDLFKEADPILVDSKLQAITFGDTSHALKLGMCSEDKIVEIGAIFSKNSCSLKAGLKKSPLMITDLTGIAAQDLAIAECVYAAAVAI